MKVLLPGDLVNRKQLFRNRYNHLNCKIKHSFSQDNSIVRISSFPLLYTIESIDNKSVQFLVCISIRTCIEPTENEKKR